MTSIIGDFVWDFYNPFSTNTSSAQNTFKRQFKYLVASCYTEEMRRIIFINQAISEGWIVFLEMEQNPEFVRKIYPLLLDSACKTEEGFESYEELVNLMKSVNGVTSFRESRLLEAGNKSISATEGSTAQQIGRTFDWQKESYVITINLKMGFSIFVDEHHRKHWMPISLQRALDHETHHVKQMAMGNFHKLQAQCMCSNWHNAAEYQAIKVENYLAKARGDLFTRISHQGDDQREYSKRDLAMKSLFNGYDGTLASLLDESRKRDQIKFMLQLMKPGMTSVKIQSLKTRMEEQMADLFDVNQLLLDEGILIKLFNTEPFGANSSEVYQQKSKTWLLFIEGLIDCGLPEVASRIKVKIFKEMG